MRWVQISNRSRISVKNDTTLDTEWIVVSLPFRRFQNHRCSKYKVFVSFFSILCEYFLFVCQLKFGLWHPLLAPPPQVLGYLYCYCYYVLYVNLPLYFDSIEIIFDTYFDVNRSEVPQRAGIEVYTGTFTFKVVYKWHVNCTFNTEHFAKGEKSLF